MTTTAARLADLRDKVFAGTRLTFDDGLFLDTHADLFALGEMANFVREKKNGNVTYYNVNKPSGALSVFETFKLQRRRSDG